MSFSRALRRSGRVLAAVLIFASPVVAAVAPPRKAKDDPSAAQLRMLDARVNLPASFRQAALARTAATADAVRTAGRERTAIAAAIAGLRSAMPGLQVDISPLTGAPQSVRNARGTLTAEAAGRTGPQIVRDFLAQHGDVYGLSAEDLGDLVLLGDSPGGSSRLRMVRMEQQIQGRPIFQSETRFLIDGSGRLTKTLGRMVPHARSRAPQFAAQPALGPAQAVARLLAAQGHAADAASFTVDGEDHGRIHLTEDDDVVAGSIDAREVLFPLAPGLLVRAWSLVVFTNGDADWYAIVDAETGALLWRKNIRSYASSQDARFRVYVQADGITPADSPAPMSPTTAVPGAGTQAPAILPTIVSMQAAMDPLASPDGWINDCPVGGCTANETQTLGNNVLACLDRVGGVNANICDTATTSILDGNGRPTGNPDANGRNRDFLGTAPRDFQTNFLPPPQGGNPEAGQTASGNGNATATAAVDIFRRGAVTSLFYISNWYHDQLFKLGFDEASGNFQQTNFSGMGLGGDRVNADAQDSSGTNNANFSTPPDGVSGRMQMYRFDFPAIDRDGDLDAEIMMHELTHGTSNRLVGNGAGLNWDPAAGMGEGWSDFFALSLLNNTNADDPNGKYASGAYATYKLGGLLDNYVYGIRRFPYSTDNTINPLTWTDVDDVTNDVSDGSIPQSPLDFNGNGGMEVHNIGEIWALTLWELRSRIIADPTGANGDVPTGNHTMLQLVTDGLKMTPIDPTFPDAREAILDADCATHACANENLIWDAFAERGLGYGVKQPFYATTHFIASHMSLKESFQMPYLDIVDPATDIVINDSLGNNNGAIDQGELVQLTIALTNPWRNAVKIATGATATLTTSTPGVTINDNIAAYGPIAPQAKVSGDSFLITLAPSVPCGSTLDFTLTTTSNLGTASTTFRLRVGTRGGTDPAVTYTSTPALAIPDGTPQGITTTLNIADDFEIADLDFLVNDLPHTWVGDVSVALRSPDVVGTDLLSLIGVTSNTNFGISGPNILGAVIDDDLPVIAANDLGQATNAAAPFTKSWLPIFNAPWSNLFGITPDPTGILSRFDGSGTKGVWTVLASDWATPDTGTLNSWSMRVTPVHFACTPFVGSATVTGTKTVSGTFEEGGTITYTVVVTNSGTSVQLDNPGNEFTDVLPAGLTLVSASATSGTAVASTGTNTVTWNGLLAPLGGSVTITINATVNSGTGGTTISNQGTISFDADSNGSNESTAQTDDPSVGGAADPTSFVVAINFAPGDFSGDGKADILWRWQGASGEVYTWSLTGSNPMTIGSFAQITPTVTDTNWEIVGTNDFDADQDTDILWRNNATGDNIVWFMTGTTVSSGALLPAVPPDWQIKGTGDFNGDTKPDILWQNVNTRDLIIWFMNGTTVQGGVLLGPPSPVTDTNWQIGGAADFDGDGKADIVWHNVATGDIVIWYMDGGTVTGGAVLAISVRGWKLTGIGDIDGDGDPDILWRNESGAGDLIVWFMANAVITGGDFITPAVSDQRWQVEGPH